MAAQAHNCKVERPNKDEEVRVTWEPTTISYLLGFIIEEEAGSGWVRKAENLPSTAKEYLFRQPKAAKYRVWCEDKIGVSNIASVAAYTPPPPVEEPQPPVADSFGIAAGEQLGRIPEAERAKWLDDMVNIGVTWVRTDFTWDSIEPTQGTKNWEGYDKLVADCNSRGLKIIATIGYTPSWANGGHEHNYEPLSAEAFGKFAGEVAARYAPQGLHEYEIWNEPNIGFWKPLPNPAKYTACLNSAYTAIHKADSKAVVITGGTSPAGNGTETISPQTWLKELYAKGAHFDAVGHHPYVDGTAPAGQLPNPWQLMSSEYSGENLRAIMSEHNDSAKQIWATELGCKRSLGESFVAERLTLAANKWKTYSWAAAMCWFTYWDVNEYGLVDGEYHPRAAYKALQSATGHVPPPVEEPPKTGVRFGLDIYKLKPTEKKGTATVNAGQDIDACNIRIVRMSGTEQAAYSPAMSNSEIEAWKSQANCDVVIMDGSADKTNGIKGESAAAWAARCVERGRAHPAAIEIGNEVYGNWFWSGDSESEVEANAYIAILKACREAMDKAYGRGNYPPLLASCAGGSRKHWTEMLHAKGLSQYVDGATCHCYPSEGASNAEGASAHFDQAEEVHNITGLPIYITEVGWWGPKFSNAEAAADLEFFAKKCQAVTWIPIVIVYAYEERGEQFGCVNNNWEHKPEYYALQKIA